MLSPDSALLGGSERISVPLAGPVSFFGFILLGPVLLIVLRVYLQVHVAQASGAVEPARTVNVDRVSANVGTAPTFAARRRMWRRPIKCKADRGKQGGRNLRGANYLTFPCHPCT